MSKGDTIEIPLSKAKLIKLLFFCVLFMAGGLWMIITDPQSSNPFMNSALLKGVASYGAVMMGLLGFYFFTKKLFDKKPGLVLDREGILDNTGAFPYGFIPWSDVSEIFAATVQASAASKQHFIAIGLINSEEYISRAKNVLRRQAMVWNVNRYGSPILISANALKTKHADLLILVKDYFESVKVKTGQAAAID